MKDKELIVYGIGPFAEYVAYVFTHDSEYKVVAHCIEEKFCHSKEFNGLPLYRFEDIGKIFSPESVHCFIAVGQNSIRKRIYTSCVSVNLRLANYISSKASTWPDLILGQNCFIGEGSVIQPFVKIGNNSIHFTTRIGHHSLIHDHTLLSGTTIGGSTTIGEGTYLGMNSTVQQKIRVGSRNIIGMNVSIERNTPDDSVYTHKGTQKRSLTYDQVNQRFLL